MVGAILKLIFGIKPSETTFAARGFRGGEDGRREHLERIGPVFAAGYHAALAGGIGASLSECVMNVEPNLRGFAYEGAAMGLGLLDRLTPWRRDRVQTYLIGAGDRHAYMVHVALGWVAARFPGRLEKQMEPLDPLLRWLLLDGYGFQIGRAHV